MNIKEIKWPIQGGRIHVKAFPGPKSTQLNHYLAPTLEEYSYDAAIIHVGIIDILRSKHNELDKLPENIIKVGNNCQKYNIGNIYIYIYIYIYQQYFHQQELILIFMTSAKSYMI